MIKQKPQSFSTRKRILPRTSLSKVKSFEIVIVVSRTPDAHEIKTHYASRYYSSRLSRLVEGLRQSKSPKPLSKIKILTLIRHEYDS